MTIVPSLYTFTSRRISYISGKYTKHLLFHINYYVQNASLNDIRHLFRVEQKLLIHLEHTISLPVCCGVRVAHSLDFYIVFFFSPLFCLCFDLRLLITPLIFSSFCSNNNLLNELHGLQETSFKYFFMVNC